ncbi:MAG: CDP-alcohol phosphatidyltransferase family protein [Bacteroidales bacterium]|nr:CDP-alcohol phosphatidyltransferase family protein [Bacteroidales bacterium]
MEGEKSLVWACYLILLAAVFDFSDGFAARLLNACSEMGKELDSLADAISFGVAPAAIMFQFIKQSMRLKGAIFSFEGWQSLVLISCILIAVFAVLRLAKFNVDPDQTTSFKGLASPANAMFAVSIPLIDAMDPESMYFLTFLENVTGWNLYAYTMIGLIGIQVFVFGKWYIMLPLALFFASLMVTNLPMFSLKIKHFNYKDNKTVINFLIFAAVMLILLQWVAVPLIITSYVIVSLVKWIASRNKKSE